MPTLPTALIWVAVLLVAAALALYYLWPRKRPRLYQRPTVDFTPPAGSEDAARIHAELARKESQRELKQALQSPPPPPAVDPKGLRDRYYWYNEDALRLEHEVVETLNDGTNYTAKRFGSAEKAEAFIKANLENPQPIGPPKGQFTKIKKV